jgi:CubicO group peptidase (beta-lactamase class C family)
LAYSSAAFVLVALSCMPLAPANAAGSISVEKAAALDGALEEIRTRFRITGLAVGIVENGLPAYARGFGVRDSRDGAPVTPHTQFHTAPISKTFTAMAILQLAENGKLSINDPVERYLPAFAGSGITLAHLLTHSAGLRDWSHARGVSDDAAVARYVEEVARHERAYRPGEGWEYSDADFNIFGAVIETASGISYPDYMQRYVLDVAGMTESTFHQPHEGASTPLCLEWRWGWGGSSSNAARAGFPDIRAAIMASAHCSRYIRTRTGQS